MPSNLVISNHERKLRQQFLPLHVYVLSIAVQTILVKMILTTVNLLSSIRTVATAGGLLPTNMTPISLAVKLISFFKQAPALLSNHLKSG